MTEPMPEPTDARRLLDAIDAERAEVERLTEDLRQQQLRQLLAEREVTDLRAERDAVEAVALDYARERDEARAEVERLGRDVADLVAERQSLRGLLGEALDGWWEEHQDAYGVPGDVSPGKIARLRAAGGLT